MPQDNTNNYHFLRQIMRHIRKSLTPDFRNAGSLAIKDNFIKWLLQYQQQQIQNHQGRQSAGNTYGALQFDIAAFWPIQEEPDILALLHTLAQQKHHISLPQVISKNQPLQFLQWQPQQTMRPNYLGIPEPYPAIPADQPDIILVPVLGYGLQGQRLGYGGGFYDRTLASMQLLGAKPLIMGITWSDCRLPDDYQAQAHDQPLHAVLTEKGIMSFV